MRRETPLDPGNDILGCCFMAMGDEPARAFRYPQAHDENDDAEHTADEKAEAPAESDGDPVGIEQEDGAGAAQSGTHPEPAIDDEIGPAAIAGRDQLLDGRVDGGIFAADPRTGQKSEEHEAPEIP